MSLNVTQKPPHDVPELPKGTEDPGWHLGQAGRLLHPPLVWLLVSHWKNPTGFNVSESACLCLQRHVLLGANGEKERQTKSKKEKNGGQSKKVIKKGQCLAEGFKRALAGCFTL